MENKDYISRQIDVSKNDKRLIEFMAKLQLAPKEFYAHIHAASDKIDENKRGYSLIGINIQDYSAGEGKSVRVSANISPALCDYILNIIRRGDEKFEHKEEKLLPNPDPATGRNQVTKLTITRGEVDEHGKPFRLPWNFTIDNGTAIAAKNANGGSYAQKNSFASEKRLNMRIGEKELYRILYNVTHFIANWEAAYAPQLIYNTEAELAEILQSKKNG